MSASPRQDLLVEWLHKACRTGNLEMMRCLVALGVDVAATKSGRTPLMVAQMYGHTDVADWIQVELEREERPVFVEPRRAPAPYPPYPYEDFFWTPSASHQIACHQSVSVRWPSCNLRPCSSRFVSSSW
eukprot:gnl/Hemi2/2012_TR717_c0_g2_i1.p1 gnl/Hemi2/2012_TR717_c0_g2~~gnl/Hemi2/2012_TR717_c0_g2_i1.p1  ORF type:complete len:129 (+),score=17.36 gnl/Hemi2/2012_TR717_c0_g2_i1:58-444(+)